MRLSTDSDRLTGPEAQTRSEPTAKAVTRDRFGSPDVLQFTDIPQPCVPADGALVAVHAAGVNQGDALEMRGWPYLARLMGYGIRHPKRRVPGTDLAGTVVAVGDDVDGFEVGDDVVGWGAGAFADIAVVQASMVIQRPMTVNVEEAAAMPTAGVTALQSVRDAARVTPGQRVAVLGASGGVGTFATQIAKAFGAEVTGVSGARNVDLIRSIGADHVLDYTSDDITSHPGRYDVIIDLVGNQPLRSLRRALTRTGTLVVVGGQNPRSLTGMRRFATAAFTSPFTPQRLVPLFSKPNRNDLAELAALITDGAVRPVIGDYFHLPDTADAVRKIETGHATGKIVITN